MELDHWRKTDAVMNTFLDWRWLALERHVLTRGKTEAQIREHPQKRPRKELPLIVALIMKLKELESILQDCEVFGMSNVHRC